MCRREHVGLVVTGEVEKVHRGLTEDLTEGSCLPEVVVPKVSYYCYLHCTFVHANTTSIF